MYPIYSCLNQRDTSFSKISIEYNNGKELKKMFAFIKSDDKRDPRYILSSHDDFLRALHFYFLLRIEKSGFKM